MDDIFLLLVFLAVVLGILTAAAIVADLLTNFFNR